MRPMMKVTLSYDHRVIDGARAAEFMKTLKELMEDPFLTSGLRGDSGSLAKPGKLPEEGKWILDIPRKKKSSE